MNSQVRLDVRMVPTIDGQDYPFCPICENPIFAYDPLTIMRDSEEDVVALAHTFCVERELSVAESLGDLEYEEEDNEDE